MEKTASTLGSYRLAPQAIQQALHEASLYHKNGKLHEAENCLQKILDQDPEHFNALHLLSMIKFQQNQKIEAIDLLKTALRRYPDSAEAHNNLGSMLANINQFKEAVDHYTRALQLKPDHAKALQNRNNALLESNSIDAISELKKIIIANPNDVESLSILGQLLAQFKQYDEAYIHLKKAISLNPKHHESYLRLGNLFQERKKYQEALACFQKTLALQPSLTLTFSSIIFCLSQLCLWEKYDEIVINLKNYISKKTSLFSPFSILNYIDDPHLLKQCNEVFSHHKSPFSKKLWQGEHYQNQKIKIAYLSADFHAHATVYLMIELFEKHDRNQFEIIAISYGPDEDNPMTTRLINAFDQFHCVREKSDEEIAQLIFRLKVDIAIDLKGYTKDARYNILAYRPAPIQVNYLGYPSTMGSPFIDYIIADKIILPEAHHSFYTEKVVYLPYCYQPNDSKRQISLQIPTRSEVGLPEECFVFCSFNNTWKITPTIFNIWLSLLKKVDKSVLWLLEDNEIAKENLTKFAKEGGINPERLIFAKRIPIEQHLARHYLADLFLDTLPYNAHTTASDALWTGLPLLTCLGNAFHSRVAASLLKAIHLPELITYNLSEYEALALKLANEPETLSSIRIKLKNNRDTTPLFNIECFRKSIESAYLEMWKINQHKEVPHPIQVNI